MQRSRHQEVWRRSAARVVLLLALLSCGASRAAAGGVAIVELDLAGLPSSERALVAATVDDALQEAALPPLEAARLAQGLEEQSHLVRCFAQPSCRAELGEALGVDAVLSGVICRRGSGYLAELTLTSVALTRVLSGERACTRCSERAFATQLMALVRELAEGLRTIPQGTLRVVSTPAGAQVSLDGRRLGTAPIERAAGQGEHLVELSLGAAPVQRHVIRIDRGQLTEVRSSLPTLSSQVPAGTRSTVEVGTGPAARAAGSTLISAAPRRAWMFPVGLSAVLLGAGALVASIPVFVFDGRCADPGCFTLHDDAAGKYTLLSIGLALGATGTTLLALRPRPDRSSVQSATGGGGQ
jgi:hypothetical protein